MGIKAPCKGCTDRTITCHTTCKKYIQFSEETKIIRDKIRKENEKYRGKNRRCY